MDSIKFGKKIFHLIIIGIFIGLAGTGVLLFTLPAVASFDLSILGPPWEPPSLSISDVMLFTFIKALISMFIPLIGGMLLLTYRRKAAAIVLFASGFITIIPIIIGNYEALSNFIQLFGIWPFLPHAISGTIFIIAGVLALLWQIEEKPRAHGFISTTVDSPTPPPMMRGPTCPACGHALFGNEKYCPECAHPL